VTTLISFDVLATNVLRDLLAFGGSTQSAVPGVPGVTSGYGVSLPGHERRIPVRTAYRGLAEDIKQYAELKRFHLARPGIYLGAWIDDGIVYLDLTEVVHDRATAERLGYDRDQLAVWDFAKSEEIRMVTPMFAVEGSKIAELGADGELHLVDGE
jgi:hypothetical protein